MIEMPYIIKRKESLFLGSHLWNGLDVILTYIRVCGDKYRASPHIYQFKKGFIPRLELPLRIYPLSVWQLDFFCSDMTSYKLLI